MARGYKTGRRKKGSLNKDAQQRDEILHSGMSPLDWMLQVLRDPSQPNERRDEMAKAAAPYVHPRLAAVDAHMDLHMSHEEMLRHLEADT
jgi:hypothetical protein